MRVCISISIFVALLFLTATQSAAQDEKAAGSISGTVTMGGKPARGVKIAALQGEPYNLKAVAIDVTDATGHYNLKNIPAGNCTVTIDAPSFVMKGKSGGRISGKSVSIDAGENIEGIDLETAQGGVITGRITEANGRPAIVESVDIIPFKANRNPDADDFNDDDDDDEWSLPASPFNRKLDVNTDDRGIYRAYGLPPGRYIVRTGSEFIRRRPSFGQVEFPVIFYPDTTDQSKAQVIEVSAGGEVTNIDIKIKRPRRDKSNGYAIAGRVVDAETGKPIPKVKLYCYKQPSAEDYKNGNLGEWVSEYSESDFNGEFRINDLPSGKYKIEIRSGKESPWYSEKIGIFDTLPVAFGYEACDQ